MSTVDTKYDFLKFHTSLIYIFSTNYAEYINLIPKFLIKSTFRAYNRTCSIFSSQNTRAPKPAFLFSEPHPHPHPHSIFKKLQPHPHPHYFEITNPSRTLTTLSIPNLTRNRNIFLLQALIRIKTCTHLN